MYENKRILLREYRVISIGHRESGQNFLLKRWDMPNPGCLEYDDFPDEDSYRKQTVIDDEPSLIDIAKFDTEQTQYVLDEGFAMAALRNAHAFIFIYSITSRESFTELFAAHQRIRGVRDDPVPMIVIGNDGWQERERNVSTQEGRALADSFGCPFVELSRHFDIDIHIRDILRRIRQFEGGYEVTEDHEENSEGQRGSSLASFPRAAGEWIGARMNRLKRHK
ncbi:Ras GTPase [Arthrobotrys megalospora]